MPLAVLRLLRPDAFRSGEEISRRLGLSRASVHNAVMRARELGTEIHAVRGQGYRLARPCTWLDAERLQTALGKRGFSIAVHDQVDSTNSRLLALSQEGAAHKTVLAAEWQSGGRGRRGRTWHGQLGGSLTFSLLWRFNRPLTGLSGLSLVVGLALARVVRELGAPAGVKWPNDLLVDGRKLAGILIETQGDMLGAASAVIGIGVNVQAGAEVAAAAGAALTDLGELLDPNPPPDRNRLLAAILAGLDRLLPEFDRDGFAPFVAAWQDAHVWQDRTVCAQHPSGTAQCGRARGVDADGALLLETAGGIVRIHAGEVSLRPT